MSIVRCAVIDGTGTVINVTQADPATDAAPAGCILVADPAPSTTPVDVGWTYSTETSEFTEVRRTLTPLPGSTPQAMLQGEAQAALDASDVTILRCTEHAVAVPSEWVTYRTALRAIVAAPAEQTLPTRPSYPAGT